MASKELCKIKVALQSCQLDSRLMSLLIHCVQIGPMYNNVVVWDLLLFVSCWDPSSLASLIENIGKGNEPSCNVTGYVMGLFLSISLVYQQTKFSL